MGIRERLLSLLLRAAFYLCAGTCRLRVKGEEVVEGLVRSGEGGILLGWHGTLTLPVYFLRRYRLTVLVSPSRDGRLLADLVRRLGWRPIMGSSFKGAVSGLKECLSALRRGEVLGIIPDGPRGPARVVQPGVIYLAEVSGRPLVPVGAFARPAKVLRSWDKHIVPIPFVSRGAVVFGKPLKVEGRLGAEGRREFAMRLKEAIERANEEARRMVLGR